MVKLTLLFPCYEITEHRQTKCLQEVQLWGYRQTTVAWNCGHNLEEIVSKITFWMHINTLVEQGMCFLAKMSLEMSRQQMSLRWEANIFYRNKNMKQEAPGLLESNKRTDWIQFGYFIRLWIYIRAYYIEHVTYEFMWNDPCKKLIFKLSPFYKSTLTKLQQLRRVILLFRI